MLITVTGANGFLGRAVVHHCRESGINVRALSRRPVPEVDGVQQVRGDVVSGERLREAFRGADAVIHTAGLAHRHHGAPDAMYREVNELAPRNVVTAAAESDVPRVVIISTVAVYGGSRARGVTDETDACMPTTTYGISKLAGEWNATAAAARRRIDLGVLRLCTVFGAEDPGNVARLVQSIKARRPLPVGIGTRKSLIHRQDAARACILAATKASSSHGVFNVVGGVYSVDEIARTIASELGSRAILFHIPPSFGRAVAAMSRRVPRLNSISQQFDRWLSDEAYSGAAFADAFGFSAEVDLRTGVRDEVEWLDSEQRGSA